MAAKVRIESIPAARFRSRERPLSAPSCRYGYVRRAAQVVESPGGVSPPGAPRSVREPLDSYGSRCSAVSMAELPVSEECWIYSA